MSSWEPQTRTSWEAITDELIDSISREMESTRAEAERRVAILEQKRKELQGAKATYRERLAADVLADNPPLDRDSAATMSHRDILRLIAKRSGGVLVARQAIRMMKDAGIFSDPANADSTVYTVLSRSKEFVKMGKGVYKLSDDEPQHKGDGQGQRATSGLREAVRELKEANPELTLPQVRDMLIRRGFDFQGKKPGNAVNMAWVTLGYARKSGANVSLQASNSG